MSIPLLMEEFERRLKMRREQRRVITPISPEAAMTIGHASRNPRSTTIVAIEWREGIVMAGDRLVTSGNDEAFSRTTVKLEDIQNNAVLGLCGMLAFAQTTKEDFEFMCDIISSRIRRAVSLEGKSNILKDVILANLGELPWCHYYWVSFAAILGGFDAHSGKSITSFDNDGGVYRHRDFFACGSGESFARAYLDDRYQYNLKFEEAVARVIGAIRQAGKYVTSVSHPADPPPTVKIISEDGIATLPEKLVDRYMTKLDAEDSAYRAKQKRRVRR